MIKKIFLKILFLIIILPINSQNELDSLLLELDTEISKQKSYDKAKELKIENLKKLISDKSLTAENKYFLTNKLIEEYEYYSFDSALFYIEKNLAFAKNINNISFIKEATLKLAKILATSGRYNESLDLVSDIHRSTIPQHLIKEYYNIYKECYSQLHFYSAIESTKQKYRNLFTAYRDSLLTQYTPNSLGFFTIEEEKLRDQGKFKEALKINLKRLAIAKSGTRDFSLAAFEHSFTSVALYGTKSNQKKYLILSAISDIKGSIKDNASLTNLAVILFEEGNIEKAHHYIDFSFEDAKFYNSKLRFLNISNVLPLISKSFEKTSLEQSKKLKKQLIFISFLSIILITSLFFIFKQYRKIKSAKEHLNDVNLKLKELNNKLNFTNSDLKRLYEELSVSDSIKEQYIGTFLNLYSEYIDKLDMYRKMVRKYIVTNKTNELLEITKSKKVVEDELKIFYSNFDKSFLHIYPNFIKNINALLKEDERIVLKKDEILNVELRIYALIRLGITNSSKIANILRYSVNTIYNYRVKIKNSAIKRDEFEDMVKKISG
jgi:hypothetical protein